MTLVKFGNASWELQVTSLQTRNSADIDTFEFLDGGFYRKKFSSTVDSLELTCTWVEESLEADIKAAYELTTPQIFSIPSIGTIEPFYAHLEEFSVDYLKLVPDTTRYVTVKLIFRRTL